MITESNLPPKSSQFNQQDIAFMQRAIAAAAKAESLGEVPIGAVLVKDDKIIAEGFNVSILEHNACGHAEVQAIQNAGQLLQNYRLVDTTLYVTLEPCAMCAGALLHSRVKRIVYGACDPKAGAAGSVLNLFESPIAFHKAEVESGLLADECKAQLQSFFKRRRAEKKALKQKDNDNI